MRAKYKRASPVATLLALAALMALSFFALAGNLEPTAAPAPTMKTLDQVEPRIPLSNETTPGDATYLYIITQAGSYYLTENTTTTKSGVKVAFISLGSIQLLVGPASSFLTLQIKVRSSTRATSLGSDRARKLLGRFSGLSLVKVPASTNSLHKRSYSSCEPSHQ